MENNKVMVGLDVGNSKVCAVVGRLNANANLEIMGFAYTDARQGVEKGVVRNVSKTTEAIYKVITEASKASDVLIGEVITNISNQHIGSQELIGNIILENSDLEIQHRDIERLISNMKKSRTHAGNTLVHVCPQEFNVDDMWGDVFNPAGMRGVKLEGKFLHISSPSMAVDNLEKSFKDIPTKTEIKEKLHSALASGLASLTEEEKEAGVALVDIGAGNTDIVIYYKNIVRKVMTLPFGGNDISRDIQQGCSVLPEIAEQLKVKFGAAISTEIPDYELVSVPGIGNRSVKDVSIKNIAIIIEERLKEMAAIIWATIIKTGYENKLSGGLVITGGTAQIPDIETLFGSITGKDIRIGQPNIGMAKSELDIGKDPAYATAIGLLWKGFKSYDARKDEIEKEKEQAKQKKGANTTIDFDVPINKNLWRKGMDLFKTMLNDEPNKIDDRY